MLNAEAWYARVVYAYIYISYEMMMKDVMSAPKMKTPGGNRRESSTQPSNTTHIISMSLIDGVRWQIQW